VSPAKLLVKAKQYSETDAVYPTPAVLIAVTSSETLIPVSRGRLMLFSTPSISKVRVLLEELKVKGLLLFPTTVAFSPKSTSPIILPYDSFL